MALFRELPNRCGCYKRNHCSHANTSKRGRRHACLSPDVRCWHCAHPTPRLGVHPDCWQHCWMNQGRATAESAMLRGIAQQLQEASSARLLQARPGRSPLSDTPLTSRSATALQKLARQSAYPCGPFCGRREIRVWCDSCRSQPPLFLYHLTRASNSTTLPARNPISDSCFPTLSHT